ncbi:MAG TPA: S9 family peptidase [Candidatus Limnocylindrales bacterium]|nr:S9 family peptidase [Candidatus Limnocylindrales bacterium]
MPRPPQPEDVYRFRVPSDPRLSPDGGRVVFTIQTAAPAFDGYRHAIWTVPAGGSTEARALTLGAKNDTHPRFSPDGGTLAFLSDRRLTVEEEPAAPKDPKEREDVGQVHLLALDGGEARRLTDLPQGVEGFEWSPDGRNLVVLSASVAATREADAKARGKAAKRKPTEPPEADFHYVDRLQYLFNGAGFVYHRKPRLWLVDAQTGEARSLTDGSVPEAHPAWSPDGTRLAFAADRHRDRDLRWRSDVWVVDVASGRITRATGGRGYFDSPVWLPDGQTLAVLGHRFPAGAGSRNDVWLFAADGSEADEGGGHNLSGRHDLMLGAAMNSDVVPGEDARVVVVEDGDALVVAAPARGSYALWRLDVASGDLARLTDGAEYVSAFDAVDLAGSTRVAWIRSTPTCLPDVHVADTRRGHPARLEGRRLTGLNDELRDEVALVEPEEHWHRVDGRDVQGWFLPAGDGASGDGASGDGARPLVTEIHGGPQTMYGLAPFWEFQVLAGAGIGVWYANPRGSEGYGQNFSAANFRDWGTGPSRDVLAGVDALVASGRADPDRLGVTGGSYGGYLTNWIIGHDRRFRAALTERSVCDLQSLVLTGDLAGAEFGTLEFGAEPWEDPDIYREQSPLTYAPNIVTPLLIQHAENDLRCTVTQAEMLFAVLRSLRRPVRLMRVPDETHELTRSGSPFRRVENLVQVRDWFRHFLVDGKRRLPPLPRARAGK